MYTMDTFFPPNIFIPQLFESTDVEPTDTEGWLYVCSVSTPQKSDNAIFSLSVAFCRNGQLEEEALRVFLLR